MAKSVAPSGLALKRNNESFTCSWKIPTKKYGEGQGMQYATNAGWKNVSIGTTTTSKALTFSRTGFYPYSGKKTVSKIQFRVRGNTAKYTEKKKKINPSMSNWATKVFPVNLPKQPSVTAELMAYPRVKFGWSVAVNSSDSYWFTRVHYQSVLVKDSNITDGSKINWSSTVGTRYDTTNGNAASSVTITDDSSQLADGHSYTRWFRVRAQGPRGNSAWRYAKHVYAMSNQCTVTNYEITPSDSANGYTVKVWFNSPYSASRPISKIETEWAIATPDAGMECPDSASWTVGATSVVKDSTGGAIFSVDQLISTDQCLFVRVNATYDDRTTYGNPVVMDVGSLAAPTITDIVTDSTQYTATITATNNSSVADSFLVVRYMDADEPDGFDIAIIPHGSTQAVGVQCPEWTSSPRFGVYAAAPAGCYEETEREDGVGSYAVDPTMKSDIVTQGGSIPDAPENVSAVPTTPSGTIRVTWEWSWENADSVELSWADHEDAWESTEQPSTYEITKLHASAWNISGLTTGVKWYVRVRLIQTTADGKAYGAYSDTAEVDLASAPLAPVLMLSDGVITQDGQVTATWVYSTTDGTAQAFAEVAEVTEDEDTGDDVYTSLVQVQTAQYVTLDAAEQGWTTGETHALAVRVASASGKESDGWSDTRTVTIADPPTCTISATSLDTIEIETEDEDGETVTEEVTALTEMPFTCTVTGAGDSGITTIAIERAAAYHVDRPDETDYNGFEGETVAIDSHTGEDEFEIALTDLIGHLDDGAWYRLVATVQDGLGQSASATLEFLVAWSHQAEAPTAAVVIDSDSMIAILTPTAPSGALATDVCDIYRLSIDRPQLIVQGATFGTQYVDPYPAVGEYGGHRFVTRTAEGDCITEDNSFAWVDTGEDDGDSLATRYNIFEFDGGRVQLELDVSISNAWRKDFKETSYLGGSVQGDWNKAVERTATIEGTAIPGRDDDLIQAMRRLADHAGICHVRSKDGSSYAANVDVSDRYNYASGIKTYVYSMTITRIEPDELDGMTLAEWNEVHEEESE